jgi:PAS domain S-box-containing protein
MAGKDTILYVDDEEINLELFNVTFSDKFNLLIASSTKEARQLLAENEVKVVISDLRMPEESGIEFIRNISPLYPDAFYIILTAYLDVNSTMQALNLGEVYRYLLKPWNVTEIVTTLTSAIQSYDLKKENKQLVSQLQDKNKELEKTLVLLKEREQQFYNIFYYSTDAIAIFRTTGEVLLANPAYQELVKIGSNESFNVKSQLSEKSLEQFDSRMAQLMNSSASVSVEYEINIGRSESRIVEASSAMLEYSGERVVLSILRDITERKQMANNILKAVMHGEEQERNRLASDLHDGLGPILSTLKMYIEWLSDKKRETNNDQILELSNKTIQEAIVQLRAISHNLSPHILERFGLIPALQSHIEVLKSVSSIGFYLNSDLKERLHADIETTLYRVIKECITNTVKHSQAQTVYIIISKEPNKLKVAYTDDGRGFDMEAIKANKGMGLYNIRNRIYSIGGTSEITSAPGKGINVSIEIKL